MTSVNPFLAAARKYRERGIVSMPLTLDGARFPKRPIVDGWPDLTLDMVEALPWQEARGIGLVLGAASSNLAAIDVDSTSLTDTLLAMFRGASPPYVVRTARNRGHIYVQEPAPSRSTRQQVRWDGMPVTVELKATGTQIAAPPTPGYSCALKGKPIEQALGAAWATIAHFLLAKQPGRFELLPEKAGANYPAAWGQEVRQDFRNNTLYVEAHRLREAGMPYADALETLLLRVERHYQPGQFSANEITRTVQSAYRKGVVPDGSHRRLSEWADLLR